MCEAVVPKVVRSAKPLVTLVAREGTLVRVGSLVDLQVVALGELPVAVLANIALLGAAGTTYWSQQKMIEFHTKLNYQFLPRLPDHRYQSHD